MSLSVDAIVILDIVPRLVWSNSRNMVRNDGGEFFFVGERHSMLQSINNETRLNQIDSHTTYCRAGSRSADKGGGC